VSSAETAELINMPLTWWGDSRGLMNHVIDVVYIAAAWRTRWGICVAVAMRPFAAIIVAICRELMYFFCALLHFVDELYMLLMIVIWCEIA